MKAEKVVEFYVVCNKLKDVIRTGWKDVWKVKGERLESVAEHIYGVQMLAIAMALEYGYDVDLMKVIMMLAVHELEEVSLGDVIPFEMTMEKRKARGRAAVAELVSKIEGGEEIHALFTEYDEQQTLEAKFARWCDKLEADLQCKLYDEAGRIDMAAQEGNKMLADIEVREIASRKTRAAEIWLEYNRRKNGYDENFLEVSKYAEEHQIALEG